VLHRFSSFDSLLLIMALALHKEERKMENISKTCRFCIVDQFESTKAFVYNNRHSVTKIKRRVLRKFSDIVQEGYTHIIFVLDDEIDYWLAELLCNLRRAKHEFSHVTYSLYFPLHEGDRFPTVLIWSSMIGSPSIDGTIWMISLPPHKVLSFITFAALG
jgi:hypothetical protein